MNMELLDLPSSQSKYTSVTSNSSPMHSRKRQRLNEDEGLLNVAVPDPKSDTSLESQGRSSSAQAANPDNFSPLAIAASRRTRDGLQNLSLDQQVLLACCFCKSTSLGGQPTDDQLTSLDDLFDISEQSARQLFESLAVNQVERRSPHPFSAIVLGVWQRNNRDRQPSKSDIRSFAKLLNEPRDIIDNFFVRDQGNPPWPNDSALGTMSQPTEGNTYTVKVVPESARKPRAECPKRNHRDGIRGKWVCPSCKTSFPTKDRFKRHAEGRWLPTSYHCQISNCPLKPEKRCWSRKASLLDHVDSRHADIPRSVFNTEGEKNDRNHWPRCPYESCRSPFRAFRTFQDGFNHICEHQEEQFRMSENSSAADGRNGGSGMDSDHSSDADTDNTNDGHDVSDPRSPTRIS